MNAGSNLLVVYIIYLFTLFTCMVMSFFSGADDIPPMGYPRAPELNFNPSSRYPTASTSALQLTLLTCYDQYDQFKGALEFAFKMHGGFGLS